MISVGKAPKRKTLQISLHYVTGALSINSAAGVSLGNITVFLILVKGKRKLCLPDSQLEMRQRGLD